MNQRAYATAGSLGAAEFGCAAMLTIPATRRFGGLCTAALMVAVYPANIYTVKSTGTVLRGGPSHSGGCHCRFP